MDTGAPADRDCSSQRPDAAPELSVVVPCHNEQAVLGRLHQRLGDACGRTGVTYEILLIDDGSTDATADEIRRLAERDPAVRGVVLSRNFGHQAAVSAGYDHAHGRAVVVMDADLQHPPEVIPQFLEKWRAGYDVVYAYRRNVPPRWIYRVYNWLTRVKIPSEAADFRLLDRAVVEALRHMPERHRFVRGLVAWLGFRQVGIPYDQAERQAGQPAYSWRSRLQLAIDSMFSFSTVPLRVSIYLGLATFALGLVYALYIFGVLLFVGRDHIASGWPALIVTVLILGGAQLMSLGMVAEYVGRIYEEVKRRPLYVVRELIEPGATRGPARALADAPRQNEPAAPATAASARGGHERGGQP